MAEEPGSPDAVAGRSRGWQFFGKSLKKSKSSDSAGDLESPRSDVRSMRVAERKKEKGLRTVVSKSASRDLTGWRRKGLTMLVDDNFNLFMSTVIVSNIGVIVHETNSNAPCADHNIDANQCHDQTLLIVNYFFLAIYSAEAALRLYVLRLQTFATFFNNLDIMIVVFGFCDVVISNINPRGMPGPSLSLLRIFRVFRLLRMVRIFTKIPELYAMLRGFLSAMKSMFWGFVMIIAFLAFFAVLCVELVHPVSLLVHAADEHCKNSFSNVWECCLLLFQVFVAGDEFGRCLIPVIKEEWWIFCIFSTCLICVQLGFMNLILAVIVERASRAREEDEEELKKEKLKASNKATIRLTNLCSEIDEDGSGSLSLEELLIGFDGNAEMQNLFAKLDMGREDVELLFGLMDVDNEGEVSYNYFIDSLRRSQLDDTRKSLMMLRLQAGQIARHSMKFSAKLDQRAGGGSSPSMSRQVSETSKRQVSPEPQDRSDKKTDSQRRHSMITHPETSDRDERQDSVFGKREGKNEPASPKQGAKPETESPKEQNLEGPLLPCNNDLLVSLTDDIKLIYQSIDKLTSSLISPKGEAVEEKLIAAEPSLIPLRPPDAPIKESGADTAAGSSDMAAGGSDQHHEIKRKSADLKIDELQTLDSKIAARINTLPVDAKILLDMALQVNRGKRPGEVSL